MDHDVETTQFQGIARRGCVGHVARPARRVQNPGSQEQDAAIALATRRQKNAAPTGGRV